MEIDNLNKNSSKNSKPKVNLIIASYGGMYARKFNHYNANELKKYLRYNLLLLNQIQTDIAQISIIKPKIDPEHYVIEDYYNFDDLNLGNIKDKIKIYECENIGISYGQFFHGISKTMDFDYHIFIEDDYIVFKDYFERDLISEYTENSFLCCYYYKTTTFDIFGYLSHSYYNEPIENYNYVKNQFNKYNYTNNNIHIPDFSLGIISKNTIQNILNVFGSFESIKEFFNLKLKKIELYQILFGFLLDIAGVKTIDFSSKYLNIFLQNDNSLYLCNIDNPKEWKEFIPDKKFDIPLFIPLSLLFPQNYWNDINLMKENYISDKELFQNKYNLLNSIKQNSGI